MDVDVEVCEGDQLALSTCSCQSVAQPASSGSAYAPVRTSKE